MERWFPIAGRSLAIDFANTAYYAHGVVTDGLATADGLRDWFAAVAPRLDSDPPVVTRTLHRQAVELRDAIRAVLADTAAMETTTPKAVATLNEAVRAAPGWIELGVRAGRLVAVPRSAAPARATLARLATDAIALATGPDRDRLRACAAPGCLGFLLQTDVRQHFCSPRCATRARVARHYDRHH